MKFTKKMLRDQLGLPYGDGDAHIVRDEITDTSRWSINHELIFKYQDKLWMVDYSLGATEYQEERPWEEYGPDDPIECTEVEEYQRLVTDYRPVKN